MTDGTSLFSMEFRFTKKDVGLQPENRNYKKNRKPANTQPAAI